jgi:ubiquitin-conjugating enzyme E2 J2
MPVRLTALLSFMLSDEMTTGSMTTTEADKRTLAKRSHDWNRKQLNFVEAFPDVSGVPLSILFIVVLRSAF